MKDVCSKSLVGVLAVLVTCSAHGADIVLRCKADFSAMGERVLDIQITKEDQGRLQSQINGKVSNQNVKADEYPVRANLNLKTDPYSPEAIYLNPAETSLLHLQGLKDHKDLRAVIKIPFDLKRVRKMKIYDLQGYQDKYGGTVLMEAYDQQGKLLGRVFRSVLSNGCS